MCFLREEGCTSHISQLNPRDSPSPTGEGHIHEHREDSKKSYKRKASWQIAWYLLHSRSHGTFCPRSQILYYSIHFRKVKMEPSLNQKFIIFSGQTQSMSSDQTAGLPMMLASPGLLCGLGAKKLKLQTKTSHKTQGKSPKSSLNVSFCGQEQWEVTKLRVTPEAFV